jgi:O-antigen ligase
VLGLALGDETLSRLIVERAQLIQTYDAGGHGRFDAQSQALSYILVSPLGIGPRDFGMLWGEEAHNVYLTSFLAGGWLAGFAYIALVLVTAARGFMTALRPRPVQGIATVIVSCFVGLAVEGLIVDTDHWRLFWVLVGTIWGLELTAYRPSTFKTHCGSTARL